MMPGWSLSTGLPPNLKPCVKVQGKGCSGEQVERRGDTVGNKVHRLTDVLRYSLEAAARATSWFGLICSWRVKQKVTRHRDRCQS